MRTARCSRTYDYIVLLTRGGDASRSQHGGCENLRPLSPPDNVRREQALFGTLFPAETLPTEPALATDLRYPTCERLSRRLRGNVA